MGWVFKFWPPRFNGDWTPAVTQKIEQISGQIRPEWLLSASDLAEASSRRDLTGKFIVSFLDKPAAEITALSALELAKKIKQRELTALETTLAFCHRAAVAHQICNCLHEIFFEQAVQRAKELDRYQEQTGAVLGPLHGVPISLKDQFYVKDVETTMGYVGWINTVEGNAESPDYKQRESVVVHDLLKLGAVLYCKTSLPQTLLLGETHNNINGYTMNPIVQPLSCGGSSGGEAALLALGGSCLGIGTDIGGSVRIPAAFCGVYAIKPSFARFPYKDTANSNPAQTVVKSAVGFMSTSLISLRLIQIALLSTKPWISDAEVIPMPWRFEYENIEETLCFGFLSCDDFVLPHPPILRALRMIEKAIKRRGHNTIRWKPPPHREASQIHSQFMYSDGGANIWEQLRLSGEAPIKELVGQLGTGPKPPLSLREYQALGLRRIEYRQRYREYWNSTIEQTGTGRPADAFIMPVAPHAAVIPGKYFYYGYTEVVNLLDYTSIVIPVTKADRGLDKAEKYYTPLNNTDKMNWEAYNADSYDGAPVGIQIVARQFQEERCLSLASEIVTALEAENIQYFTVVAENAKDG